MLVINDEDFRNAVAKVWEIQGLWLNRGEGEDVYDDFCTISGDSITKEAYMKLLGKLHILLVPPSDTEEKRRCCLRDWEIDRGRSANGDAECLNFDAFLCAWCELACHWVGLGEEVKTMSHHVDFVDFCYEGFSEYRLGEVERIRVFKRNEEISYGGTRLQDARWGARFFEGHGGVPGGLDNVPGLFAGNFNFRLVTPYSAKRTCECILDIYESRIKQTKALREGNELENAAPSLLPNFQTHIVCWFESNFDGGRDGKLMVAELKSFICSCYRYNTNPRIQVFKHFFSITKQAEMMSPVDHLLNLFCLVLPFPHHDLKNSFALKNKAFGGVYVGKNHFMDSLRRSVPHVPKVAACYEKLLLEIGAAIHYNDEASGFVPCRSMKGQEIYSNDKGAQEFLNLEDVICKCVELLEAESIFLNVHEVKSSALLIQYRFRSWYKKMRRKKATKGDKAIDKKKRPKNCKEVSVFEIADIADDGDGPSASPSFSTFGKVFSGSKIERNCGERSKGSQRAADDSFKLEISPTNGRSSPQTPDATGTVLQEGDGGDRGEEEKVGDGKFHVSTLKTQLDSLTKSPSALARSERSKGRETNSRGEAAGSEGGSRRHKSRTPPQNGGVNIRDLEFAGDEACSFLGLNGSVAVRVPSGGPSSRSVLTNNFFGVSSAGASGKQAVDSNDDREKDIKRKLMQLADERVFVAEAHAEMLALERERVQEQDAFIKQLERQRISRQQDTDWRRQNHQNQVQQGQLLASRQQQQQQQQQQQRRHIKKAATRKEDVKFDPKSMGIVGVGTQRGNGDLTNEAGILYTQGFPATEKINSNKLLEKPRRELTPKKNAFERPSSSQRLWSATNKAPSRPGTTGNVDLLLAESTGTNFFAVRPSSTAAATRGGKPSPREKRNHRRVFGSSRNNRHGGIGFRYVGYRDARTIREKPTVAEERGAIDIKVSIAANKYFNPVNMAGHY